MSLIIVWSLFIFTVSHLDEFNQYHYLCSSCIMFCLTCLYNKINFTNISLRAFILFFNIPSLILWYIAFVYNDFLSINPISCELLMTLFFIYVYLIVYAILGPELTSV